MRDILVCDYMRREPVTVPETYLLVDAIRTMRANNLLHLCIVDGQRPIGVLSDRDLKRALPSALLGDRNDFDSITMTTTVGRIMTRDPHCIAPNDDLHSAAVRMYSNRIGCLPVVEGGALVGVLTERCCLAALAELLPMLADPPQR
jgi:acetoin utilization protein AcuB